MTDKEKSELLKLISALHDHARDYGHARGNNDAYHMAKNKAGMIYADAIDAAARADAALDNVVVFIATL
jgi:hypothetical protein